MWLGSCDMESHFNTRTISLSQKQYILDMLKRYGMSDCKPVSTPMSPGSKLSTSMAPSSPEDILFMKSVLQDMMGKKTKVYWWDQPNYILQNKFPQSHDQITWLTRTVTSTICDSILFCFDLFYLFLCFGSLMDTYIINISFYGNFLI